MRTLLAVMGPLRSDTNSLDSWKKFASANYGDPAAIPFLDVNYADEGAGFDLPAATFEPSTEQSSNPRCCEATGFGW